MGRKMLNKLDRRLSRCKVHVDFSDMVKVMDLIGKVNTSVEIVTTSTLRMRKVFVNHHGRIVLTRVKHEDTDLSVILEVRDAMDIHTYNMAAVEKVKVTPIVEQCIAFFHHYRDEFMQVSKLLEEARTAQREIYKAITLSKEAWESTSKYPELFN
jgi:hypothetical protein